MKKGTLWKRVVSALVSLAVIAYIGYQIYSVYHDVLKTEYALSYTYHQTLPLKAFLLRNEEIMTTDSTGVVGYCQASGSKIAAGHVVARIFKDDSQAAIQARMDEIDSITQNLKGLQTAGTQMSGNAQAIDVRINETLNRLLQITDTRSTKGFDAVSDELLQLLTKKQMALGTAGDFAAYLENLKVEKASLEQQLQSFTQVTAEKSGYFVNQTDGFETLLSYDKAAELTVDDITRANDAASGQTVGIGKIILSNEWYLAAVIPQEAAQNLQVDETVKITIPLLSDEVYTCTVVALNVDYAAGKTALILSCAQMNAQVAAARHEQAELRVNTYQGLRVNQSALRVVDGITGVYVVSGITAAFKPVDILYSDAGFAICAYDAANNNGLKLYDEVITEGSDLYDGKIIR